MSNFLDELETLYYQECAAWAAYTDSENATTEELDRLYDEGKNATSKLDTAVREYLPAVIAMARLSDYSVIPIKGKQDV